MKIKKINLNKFNKIVEEIYKNEKYLIENEYNIDMGNSSYFKIITTKDLNNWKVVKINKKSKREIFKNETPKGVYNKLLNIAISI